MLSTTSSTTERRYFILLIAVMVAVVLVETFVSGSFWAYFLGAMAVVVAPVLGVLIWNRFSSPDRMSARFHR